MMMKPQTQSEGLGCTREAGLLRPSRPQQVTEAQGFSALEEAGPYTLKRFERVLGASARRACCGRPAPSRLPTRMVEAVATPKGNDMKRNTHSVRIAVCASSSTVPVVSG